jgi:hypothetical protein
MSIFTTLALPFEYLQIFFKNSLTFNKVISDITKNHRDCGDNPLGEISLKMQHQPVKYSHSIVITQDIVHIELVNLTEIFLRFEQSHQTKKRLNCVSRRVYKNRLFTSNPQQKRRTL